MIYKNLAVVLASVLFFTNLNLCVSAYDYSNMYPTEIVEETGLRMEDVQYIIDNYGERTSEMINFIFDNNIPDQEYDGPSIRRNYQNLEEEEEAIPPTSISYIAVFLSIAEHIEQGTIMITDDRVIHGGIVMNPYSIVEAREENGIVSEYNMDYWKKRIDITALSLPNSKKTMEEACLNAYHNFRNFTTTSTSPPCNNPKVVNSATLIWNSYKQAERLLLQGQNEEKSITLSTLLEDSLLKRISSFTSSAAIK